MRFSAFILGSFAFFTPLLSSAQPADGGVAEETGSGDDEASVPHAALDVALAARVFSRDLTYNDDLFAQLDTYSLGAAPAAALELKLYPLAFSSQEGVAPHLGVEGTYEQLFATDSERESGESIDTIANFWFLGVRGRLPIDEHALSVGLGYGQQSFSFGESDDPPAGELSIPAVPDVDYKFIRAGLDFRVSYGKLSALFEGHYLHVLDSGEIEDLYFPRSSVAGIEAGIELGYAFMSPLEVRLGADMRRYFYDLKSKPGDSPVAGGAVDQYLATELAIAWRM